LLKQVAERPQTYSSPAILERRKRILKETRTVIAERGIAGLNMSEIGLRAGVAKRTLYNAFQTREGMIASAIQEYFDDYVEHIPYEHPAGTMLRDVERLVSLVDRNLEIRNYVRAIHAIYFSSEGDSGIWDALHSMVLRPTLERVNALSEGGYLHEWIDIDQLADDLVRHCYATMNEWSIGRIKDGDIKLRLMVSYLTIVAGATRGAAREEVETLLARIADEGVAALPTPKHIPPVIAE
jgi:AcrR family transcriptional regulator